MATATDTYFTSSFQYSPVDQTQNIAHKRRVIEIMRALSEASIDDLPEIARDGYHRKCLA